MTSQRASKAESVSGKEKKIIGRGRGRLERGGDQRPENGGIALSVREVEKRGEEGWSTLLWDTRTKKSNFRGLKEWRRGEKKKTRGESLDPTLEKEKGGGGRISGAIFR